MTKEEILAKIEDVGTHLPKSCDDLVKQIDAYIFNAQRGFDYCTELYILEVERQAVASTSYKRALAIAMKEAEASGVAASCRKEWALARVVENDCAMTEADTGVMVARLMRDRYLERLNSYKRIKSDNFNTRGAG